MANKKINQLVSKTTILSTDIFGIGDATTGQLFKKTIAELQAAIGGAVISVNGLVGTVVLDTDDIQELATPTNKYFTDARARGAISLTVTGNSGASTYSSGTGVLNVPTYTLAGLGGISATFLSGTSGISYNSSTGVISYSGTVYTDASIRALLSGSTGISYNSTTGAISYSGTVYTDSSVRALISITTTGTSGASTYNNTTGVINVPTYTLAGLGGISLTSLSGGTGITYNNTTGAISYSGTVYTDASVRALISASGAVSYNNTTGVISLTSGNLTEATSSVLTITGGTGAVLGAGTSIQVKQASSTVSGFLSSTDFNTFNGKASALSGTTGYHAKFTSSTAIGNSVIYDDGTSVGFGTTTLSASTNYIGVNINGTTGSEIYLKGSNVSYGYIYANSSTVVVASLTAIPLVFQTNGGEKIRITSDGNLGIGTTTPGTKLTSQVSTGSISGTNDGIRLQVGTYSDTARNTIVWGQDSSNLNLGRFGIAWNLGTSQMNFVWRDLYNGAVGTTELMRLTGGGNLGIGTSSPGAQLVTAQSNANTTTVHYLAFRNLASGYGSWSISKADDNNLSFNYGVDSDTPSAGYNMKLRYNGVTEIRTTLLINTTSNNGENLYVSGTIRATGTITANSDIRLKSNITKIENALEKVGQISGYTYNTTYDDKRHGGVIAQEMIEVFPEIVNTGNDGLMGVEYGNISALLIEAIKEQNTKIKNLETLLASK
jgi:hypothetical protein